MTVDLSAGLSVDEFLDRIFDRECEFIGGETRPKPFGTQDHSRMEKRLTRLLEAFYGEDRAQFELSALIGDDVLFPDVCVYASESPAMRRDILAEAPLLCVEVLSPLQRPGEMLAKCERYRDFGVPFCWVVDPATRRAWEWNAGQPAPVEIHAAFSGPCAIPLGDLFVRQT